ALPTPPQEVYDNVPSPTILKREYPAPVIESGDAADLSGYDSDIFMSFGDKEINEFCACSKASAVVAKDYLLRADGNIERAVRMYFDDVESSQVPVIPPSPTPLPEKNKRKKEKDKKKVRAGKPITKSTEQVAQEAELRRLADREREQK